ncbi:unnamed protein product [Dracunculus medinensis]|uniref:CAS_C domain-containing protein n=1 Tax=Dracunculus medinensis TaxID=318479 RepID=A0A0N4UB12_DRAME|nr:unnamed protein product [Dracunculus medinensis]
MLGCFSNGRSMGSSPTISTTLLSERFLKGTNSSASTGTADRSTPTINDDQSKPRAHTPIPITISKSASCLRPEIATKPKLITIFQNLRDKNKNLKANNTAISANSDMNFVNKPKNGPDEIAEIAWRLKNLAKSRIDNTSAITKSENRIQVQHSSPLNTAICDQNIARISNSSNDSDSDSIVLHAAPVSDSSNLLLNTTLLEDGNTSSPSSSGIVADLNDSNTDSNQRASATSSISASSSYEQSSDLNEPGYDTPRAPSETNNDHQPHFHDSVTTSRNPRLQQKSSSALHNLFTELSLNNRWRKNPETAFNYSLNLDNRPSWGKRFERSPSTAPEGFYGTLRFDVDENRGKREISVAPELLSMSKYKDCNNCDDEALSRKRIVCAKLSENFRLIDIAVKKMNECTAPRAWRQPHILQRHLPDIKDIVHNISFATNSFMDAIYLIAIDTSNSKSDDLRQLSAPLRNSQMLINQLKQNLDNTGWTLATLSRPRTLHGPAPGNDALDQFIAVVKQLPNDCYKILQWTLSLSPSATVLFLSSKPFERNDQLSHFHRNGLPSIPVDDPKRYSSLSSTSTSTNMTVSSDDILPSASAANKLLHNQMGSANLYSLRVGENRPINTETVYSRNSSNGTRVNSSVSEGRVMEEDDLESILSDRESISQDYAIVGEDTQLKQRRRPTTNVPPTQQIDTKIIASLSDDDRQLLRFYSPQMDGHTDFLSKAIEEFLNVVEEQQPPREFVQKGKLVPSLVILAAHKLIYIGDSISQCIGSVPLSSEIRRAADRLCCILKNCVQTTKQAADEYPSVSAIQSMVDCIVTVSHAAHDLKLLVKQCCC